MAKKDATPKPAPSNLDAILKAIQDTPPPSAATTRHPLGPPAEFYGERETTGATPPGFQPFLQGDEWQPAYAPPELRARFQAKMNAAGLYGTKGYQPGVWTPDDADAYKSVLESANARGVSDPEQALDLFSQEARVTSPKVKQPRAPLVTQYADPESVRQVIRDSSLKIMGKRLSDEEEQRIIAGYQSYSAGSQAAEYSAGNPEGLGGSFTAPMSAADYAQAQIEGTHALDVGAQRYLGAFEQIVGSLGTVVNAPKATGGGGVA